MPLTGMAVRVHTDKIAAYLEDNHGGTLSAVSECADATVAQWDGQVTSDPSMITDPLEACIERSGTGPQLLAILQSGVRMAGYSLAADPVPAPPYLTITSLGPVLRGPVPDGRLVISIELFEIRDGTTRTYHRTEEAYRISIDWISD